MFAVGENFVIFFFYCPVSLAVFERIKKGLGRQNLQMD